MDIHPSPPPGSPDSIPEFIIPATVSLQERRPRTLKHGDTFAVFDHNGDLVPGEGAAEGIVSPAAGDGKGENGRGPRAARLFPAGAVGI